MLARRSVAMALFIALPFLALGQSLSPAQPGGEHTRWRMTSPDDLDKNPWHYAQYDFWFDEVGVLRGELVARNGGKTYPLHDLKFDGTTLSFSLTPSVPAYVLKANGDRFEGTVDFHGLPAKVLLVRPWD